MNKGNRCKLEVEKLKVSSRLTAAGQIFRAQSHPSAEPAIPLLPGDRPLQFQQRPLSSDEPGKGPSDSCPPWPPALRGPKLTSVEWSLTHTSTSASGAEAKSGRAGVRGRVPRLVQQSPALRAQRDATLAVAICSALNQPGLLQRQQPQ
jgi:hypothetical protein